VVSAAEFVLEGLYAHKRIGRSEERVFTAGEKQPRRAEAGFGGRESREGREAEPPQFRRGRGGYN
jgi:magnesium chelatase subunit I